MNFGQNFSKNFNFFPKFLKNFDFGQNFQKNYILSEIRKKFDLSIISNI